MSVEATQWDNAVALNHLQQGTAVMNPLQVQLRQDSFTTPVTFTSLVHAIKQTSPIKYEVCTVCFPNLKLNASP